MVELAFSLCLVISFKILGLMEFSVTLGWESTYKLCTVLIFLG